MELKEEHFKQAIADCFNVLMHFCRENKLTPEKEFFFCRRVAINFVANVIIGATQENATLDVLGHNMMSCLIEMGETFQKMIDIKAKEKLN